MTVEVERSSKLFKGDLGNMGTASNTPILTGQVTFDD